MHLCSPICQAFICILLPARPQWLFAIVTRSIVLWKEGRRLRKKECRVGLQMKTTILQFPMEQIDPLANKTGI